MWGSLLFKLLGAFTIVILVLAVGVSFLANRAALGEFRLYTTRTGQAWAERLAPLAADHYARVGSWEGVATVLQSTAGMGMMMGSGGMMGNSMMQGMHGSGPGGGPALSGAEVMASGGWDMWTMMGQRLVLADDQGQVVSDSTGELIGRSLSSQDVAGGLPVVVNGRRVGTLLVSADNAALGTPAGQFVASVNRSILLAGLAAGVIALALGSALFIQLTAPIRGLTVAARAIAAGDLHHRVPVRSRDELGELARSFNAMADSLARAEGQRSHMVADIAHELRTPLSVIQGNLEAMLDGVLPLDAGQVSLVHGETLLLGRLIADLRLLSLADTGELQLERAETDLEELIRRVVERMRPRAQERGVDLQANLPPVLPTVFIDADRITQSIGNLLSNALRYTSAGGRVRVECKVTSQQSTDHRSLSTDHRSPSTDHCLLVTVTDTGTGIATDDLPYIFDRFYRADKSRARASGGSGLGLTIVRHLVEAHGGKVWAESPVFSEPGQPGYGTRISFTLPIGPGI